MATRSCEADGRYSYAAKAAMEREGELAQLARAPDLHSGGHRFDSGILHQGKILLR